jgi:hypothetical protein
MRSDTGIEVVGRGRLPGVSSQGRGDVRTGFAFSRCEPAGRHWPRLADVKKRRPRAQTAKITNRQIMASLQKRKNWCSQESRGGCPSSQPTCPFAPSAKPPRGKGNAPGTRKCARPGFTCARRQVTSIREVTVGAVFLTVGLRGVVFP